MALSEITEESVREACVAAEYPAEITGLYVRAAIWMAEEMKRKLRKVSKKRTSSPSKEVKKTTTRKAKKTKKTKPRRKTTRSR